MPYPKNQSPITNNPAAAGAAWFCLQTAPKQENKVARLLRREIGLDVYAPKIRFRRSRAGTPIWWSEALFPGYVFAHFDYYPTHRQVRALPGVATIVQFGDRPAALGDDVLAALRAAIGDSETVEISGVAEAASEVVVIEGPLRGLQLLVTRVMPARERVAVLMEFLGAEREVEINASSVVPANPRSPSASGGNIRR